MGIGAPILVNVRTNVLTSFISTDMLFLSRLAMRFTWDENKNRQNLRKHDVRFETAVLVFDDPYAITRRDVIVEDEERWDNGRSHRAGFDSIGRPYFL